MKQLLGTRYVLGVLALCFLTVTNSLNAQITGGTITYSNGYTIHKFTSSGTLVVPSGVAISVDVLVVAGGGGGGNNGGGGGGAGGVVYQSTAISTGSVSVTVGSGGAGALSVSTSGSDGTASSFGSVSAVGGGGGGSRDGGGGGRTGGSGGGGGGGGSPQLTGGTGTSGQGNAGGDGISNNCISAGGGGGGAGVVGTTGQANIGGNGGAGVSNSITGTAVFYGGGGGAGITCNNTGFGTGGSGGGGNGGGNPTLGTAGTPNTGGGGGGGGGANSGIGGQAGGSGVVIVRYLTPSVTIAATSTTICAGTSVTFTPTPINGGSSPTYEWKNGSTTVGTDATYVTTDLANNDVITCVMTSNLANVSPTTATSVGITMTVIPTVTPSVSVTANPSGTITPGTSVTFTATPTNEGTSPSYVWKKGSTIVGTNSTIYTDAGLANGDVITCVMTSNATCASPASVTSNQITMTVTTGEYLNFDGVDDAITATQQITVKDNFTIEFWARPTGTTALPAQATSGYGGLTGQKYALHPPLILDSPSSPDACAGVTVGTNGVCVIEHNYGYLPSLLTWSGTISGWTHIAVVYTNKQPKLYVNCNLVATGLTSLQTNVIVTTTNYGGGQYGYFSGDMDDLRIWNTSLSLDDILARKNAELVGNEAGLIDYYKFNQGVASGTNTGVTTLTDATTGNNGTLNNNFALTGTASNWLAPSPFTVGIPACPVLPITWLDFNGKNENGHNLLSWATANEVNNKGFQVERRTGNSQQVTGDSWDVLGFVKTQGKGASYDFTDNTPLSISYYRLRQIDYDGTESLSKIVTISSKGNNRLKVYPNPVSNVLTVETTEQNDFQILNLLGQEILNGKTAQRIDVSALPQGAYFLKVGTEQMKFVKQ